VVLSHRRRKDRLARGEEIGADMNTARCLQVSEICEAGEQKYEESDALFTCAGVMQKTLPAPQNVQVGH
jgi:hypothetical protein